MLLLWALFIAVEINSLLPSDAKWQQRSRSTLAQVMACCLMASNHYLKQCWLIIKGACGIHLRAIVKLLMNLICNTCSEDTPSKLLMHLPGANDLTHWGRVTHICVSNLIIIGSDNGLSPGRRQAIIWTNAGILLIGLLGTNFSEILTEIHIFSFKKMHLKMSSAKFCLGLNVLTPLDLDMHNFTWKFAYLYFRQWLVTYSVPSHYVNKPSLCVKLFWKLTYFHSQKWPWNYNLQGHNVVTLKYHLQGHYHVTLKLSSSRASAWSDMSIDPYCAWLKLLRSS